MEFVYNTQRDFDGYFCRKKCALYTAFTGNSSFDSREILNSQELAIITLADKTGKDQMYLET